jgi:hypothetical protein
MIMTLPRPQCDDFRIRKESSIDANATTAFADRRNNRQQASLWKNQTSASKSSPSKLDSTQIRSLAPLGLHQEMFEKGGNETNNFSKRQGRSMNNEMKVNRPTIHF